VPRKRSAPKPLETIWEVSDDLWARIEPILKQDWQPSPKGGQPPKDWRPLFNGIIHRLRSGCQWNRLPKQFGDDSTLHCGDCHTVGQYRLADVNVKPFNKAVIGAHGSANEYLLRNSIGTNERHVGWQYSGSGVSTNNGQPMLVCFMCHKDNVYNNYGATGNNFELVNHVTLRRQHIPKPDN
jgi:transposase